MSVPAAVPNLIYRVIKDRVFQALVVLFSFLTFLPLLLIIWHILQNGIAVVDWQSITLGSPLSDVAYFLGAGLLPQVEEGLDPGADRRLPQRGPGLGRRHQR